MRNELLKRLQEVLRDYEEPQFPDTSLSALALVRHLVDQLIQLAVSAARLEGYSWEDIGSALGIARQSAWERYHLLASIAHCEASKLPVNISLPYLDNIIEPLTYTIRNGMFTLILEPVDAKLMFDDDDVQVSRGDGEHLPLLSHTQLQRFRKRKGEAVSRYEVAFPCGEGNVGVSYMVRGNYLHIILKPSDFLQVNKDQLQFTRVPSASNEPAAS